MLVHHITSNPSPKDALSDGFLEVDASLANSRVDCEFSGSTAVVSFLKVCLCVMQGRLCAVESTWVLLL